MSTSEEVRKLQIRHEQNFKKINDLDINKERKLFRNQDHHFVGSD